uniref:Adenosine kinase n=1 Tax=Fibrocapsa japonica TaxID=94617 RepID=A0A7S2UW56_9STRA|mmetsp:Transcript_1647/g.2280  ORF Transcript_1647/g.2280 Transcript_1647/m.2280 type:complete len:345 (+) Transcript_1647:71-1105(+)|eukprot:CAMPEP_0113944064 /NCGR_PEP_ID=MMETSP1339-20121228/30612_1 /TAXON_ID=94617 /ORGANISM="Fibrocapsa japonica" /LENGTH=344 /DNA_ID=CAMNT_0000949129 /DNA_START=68 /DNA_END=1102 /DNA_ORIENTATION=+ /assembly_acc=CAM_ASM_000762
MAAFTEETGVILGMGNPLLDISAEVGDDVLQKYEVSMNNAILAEEKHLPVYEELVSKYEVQYIAGGATQNSIRVAQWMIGKPQATSFMGSIGDDNFASQMKTVVEKDGVQAHYMINAEHPTGTCAVLIKGGERSLIANLAAANHFAESHLDTDKAKELVSNAKIVYIAGFFLTVSVDSILRVANQCVEGSKIFCMNLSAPFICQFFGDQLSAAMMFCDFVFGNESEAAALGEAKEWGSDLKTIALKTAALPKACGTRPRIVVITQGSTATLVACGGEVTEYPVEPLEADKLVDTNGAGDAFVGGFLAQLVAGKPIAECVRAGHWAAREIIQMSGCQPPETCGFA